MNKTVLLKTSNYGQNWTEIFIDSVDQIKQFSFPSIGTGYFIKSNGDIFKTVNGGSNWTQVSSPVTGTTSYLKFENDTLGYCSGASGQLWKTMNGGSSWTSEVTNCTNNIYAIYTFSNDVAYFVDNTNKVYKNKPNVGVIKNFLNIKEINLFPNPANDKLTIDLSSMENTIQSIKLMNVSGQIIFCDFDQNNLSQANYILSIKEIPGGIYFLFIECEGRTISRKISVVH